MDDDNFALSVLRAQLIEQRTYLRQAGEQVDNLHKRLTDAQADRDRRQRYVVEIEAAIKAAGSDSVE